MGNLTEGGVAALQSKGRARQPYQLKRPSRSTAVLVAEHPEQVTGRNADRRSQLVTGDQPRTSGLPNAADILLGGRRVGVRIWLRILEWPVHKQVEQQTDQLISSASGGRRIQAGKFEQIAAYAGQRCTAGKAASRRPAGRRTKSASLGQPKMHICVGRQLVVISMVGIDSACPSQSQRVWEQYMRSVCDDPPRMIDIVDGPSRRTA